MKFYWRSFTGEVLLGNFYWRSFTGEILLEKFYWRNFTGELFTGEILLEIFLEKFYWVLFNFTCRLAPLPTHRSKQRSPNQAPRALRTCRRWSRSFFGRWGMWGVILYFDLSYIDYVKCDACEDRGSRTEYRDKCGQGIRKKSVMVETFYMISLTGGILLEKFYGRNYFTRENLL